MRTLGFHGTTAMAFLWWWWWWRRWRWRRRWRWCENCIRPQQTKEPGGGTQLVLCAVKGQIEVGRNQGQPEPPPLTSEAEPQREDPQHKRSHQVATIEGGHQCQHPHHHVLNKPDNCNYQIFFQKAFQNQKFRFGNSVLCPMRPPLVPLQFLFDLRLVLCAGGSPGAKH